MPHSALAGLKVLDLGRGVSAPFCARLLADYGADVLKIESPGEGDTSRHCGLFLYLNANKRGITLDLESETGLDLLKRLVKDADVLVENFAPGYLAGLGLGADTLSLINTSLVQTSISWFGQTGPYRDYGGSDLVAQALGGLMNLTGLPDREPLKLPASQAEYLAGLNAAGATLAALHWRDQSGQGQQVDMSVMECVASILEGAVLSYGYSGSSRQRSGSRHPLLYPSGILPAADGYLYVDAGGDLETLARFLGVPDLADKRFKDDPRGHADEIDALIAPVLQERSRDEMFHAAQVWRLPFGQVLDMADLLHDLQCVARADFVSVESSAELPVTLPGAPFKMSNADWRTSLPAPRLGEHNVEVFCDRLGLDKARLDALREEGII